MIITNEFIELGKSAKGGYSKYKLNLLGVPWPPISGWKETLIGKEIPDKIAVEYTNSNSVKLDTFFTSVSEKLFQDLSKESEQEKLCNKLLSDILI